MAGGYKSVSVQLEVLPIAAFGHSARVSSGACESVLVREGLETQTGKQNSIFIRVSSNQCCAVTICIQAAVHFWSEQEFFHSTSDPSLTVPPAD
jgi:hypothetical protein